MDTISAIDKALENFRFIEYSFVKIEMNSEFDEELNLPFVIPTSLINFPIMQNKKV